MQGQGSPLTKQSHFCLPSFISVSWPLARLIVPVAGCPFASPKIDLLCQQAFASGSFSLFSPPPRFRCENPVDSHNALSFGFFVQKILSIRGYGSLAKWLIPALDAPSITALLRGLHFHPPHISSCKWIGFDFLKYLPFCHWKIFFGGGKFSNCFSGKWKRPEQVHWLIGEHSTPLTRASAGAAAAARESDSFY